MKYIIAAFLILLVLSGCASEGSTSKSSTGTYTSADETFKAEVTKDQIEIFFVDGDSEGLYWSGTWSTGSKVTSKANVEKLEASILGSQSKTKVFEVDGDKIEFDLMMMGTRSHVVLKK